MDSGREGLQLMWIYKFSPSSPCECYCKDVREMVSGFFFLREAEGPFEIV